MRHDKLLLELSTQVQDDYLAKKLNSFQEKSLRVSLFANMIEMDKLVEMQKQTVALQHIGEMVEYIANYK